MRTADRTNRLVDELRAGAIELEARLKRVEDALQVAFPGRFITPDHPVIGVSGDDARRRKL